MRWRRACAGWTATRPMPCSPRRRWRRWRWPRVMPACVSVRRMGWSRPRSPGPMPPRGHDSSRPRAGSTRRTMHLLLPIRMRRWCWKAACSICVAIASTNARWRWACSVSPRSRCRKQASSRSPCCSPACSRKRLTTTARRAPPRSPCAMRCCWSPAARAPARPPPPRACWCCWSRRRCTQVARRHASRWPRPPAVPPSAWPRACARRYRRWPHRAWTRICSPHCPPAAPPCIACSARFRIPHASATTATTRCRSMSWSSTRRR